MKNHGKNSLNEMGDETGDASKRLMLFGGWLRKQRGVWEMITRHLNKSGCSNRTHVLYCDPDHLRLAEYPEAILSSKSDPPYPQNLHTDTADSLRVTPEVLLQL